MENIYHNTTRDGEYIIYCTSISFNYIDSKRAQYE